MPFLPLEENFVFKELRGNLQKNSIFIGGREVHAISKNWKEMIFWQKLESEGVTKHIVKNRSTLLSKPQPNPKYKNNLNIKTTPKKKLFPINEDDSKIEDNLLKKEDDPKKKDDPKNEDTLKI